MNNCGHLCSPHCLQRLTFRCMMHRWYLYIATFFCFRNVEMKCSCMQSSGVQCSFSASCSSSPLVLASFVQGHALPMIPHSRPVKSGRCQACMVVDAVSVSTYFLLYMHLLVLRNWPTRWIVTVRNTGRVRHCIQGGSLGPYYQKQHRRWPRPLRKPVAARRRCTKLCVEITLATQRLSC